MNYRLIVLGLRLEQRERRKLALFAVRQNIPRIYGEGNAATRYIFEPLSNIDNWVCFISLVLLILLVCFLVFGLQQYNRNNLSFYWRDQETNV